MRRQDASGQRPLPHQLARGGARQRRRELDPLRHLEPGQRLGAVAAQLVRRRPRQPLCEDDDARSPPAATRGPRGRPPRRRRPAGWRSSTSSTSAGITFSPPLTIMSSIRSLDVEEALLVDAAEVAGVQPAVGVGAARGDGRALDEDLAVLDPQVGGQQRPPGGAELAPGVGRAPASSPASRSRSGRRSGRRSRPRPSASSQRLRRAPGRRRQDRPRAGEVGAGLEQPDQHASPPARRRRDPVALQRARRPGRRRSRRGRPRWSRR